MIYTKRYDTFMKRWVLERHDGKSTYYVSSYKEENDITRVVNLLNEAIKRADVS